MRYLIVPAGLLDNFYKSTLTDWVSRLIYPARISVTKTLRFPRYLL